MAWMAEEEERQVSMKKVMKVYNKVFDDGFEDFTDDWKREKLLIFKNTDSLSSQNRRVEVDWSGVDSF
ncbi:unnamed protein product [[Candida] boidinii]|nr:unnamed protein product [[Candida] boidinii]